jgi:25S rRNA (uracil2843-N3)-methyltransferase
MTQNSKETRSRPGWRGPGMTKSTKKPQIQQTPKSKTLDEEPLIPVDLQQQLLNVFRNTFSSLSQGGAENVKPLLQEVKQALFERDFARAFGRQDYLEAYAFRWSPSRALCYATIFVDVQDHLSETFLFNPIPQRRTSIQNETVAGNAGSIDPIAGCHVACLGGGAAEVVAIGGLLKYLQESGESNDGEVSEAVAALPISDGSPSTKVNLLLIDTAEWSDVASKLTNGLMSPPPLSKYASTTAKASNVPLLREGSLTTTFDKQDLLEMSKDQLGKLLGRQPMLVTLLFTLNELYTSSITKTTAFLLNLTAVVPQGTMLLVVDSPGSYSEATVGKDSKKYPMQWLMDHTLLEKKQTRGEEVIPDWEKLVSDDSRWFRLSEELKYPISLENMRCQVHLFRRL